MVPRALLDSFTAQARYKAEDLIIQRRLVQSLMVRQYLL
jgi:hypothetical protein